MAYAAGPVVSEYRLSFAKLSGDIASVERMLKTIKPPQLAITGPDDTKAIQSAVQLERANASLAAAVARTEAAQSRAATTAAAGYQRMVTAQNAAAVSSQRVTQAEQGTAQAIARTTRETANAASAQSRAEASAIRLARAKLQLAAAEERAARGGATWLDNLAGSNARLSGLVSTIGTVGAAAGALGGAFVAVQAAQAGLDFARTGASIQAARQSFDSLAQSAGTSGQALLTSLQQVSAGTVANTDIIKSSNTALLLLGSDVATKLPQLLAVAKASATTLGTDVGQVFDSLVTGISRGSTELIDNAGITIKAGEAYATYAASVGKTADALSASERQQAILNAVLTSGQQIIAQTSASGESAAATYQRFDATLANLTATAQTAAANIGAPLVNAATAGLASLEQLISRAAGAGSQADTTGAAAAAGAGTDYDAYTAAIERHNAVLAIAKARVDEFGASLGPLGAGMASISNLIFQQQHGITALNEAQFAYAAALRARGADEAAADASARAHGETLLTLESVYQTTGGALDAYRAQIAEVSAANEGNLQAVANLAAQYAAGQISIEQFRAGLDGLAASTAVAEAAAAANAAANVDQAAATVGAAEASLAAANAANAAALATLEQEVAAQRTSQAHDALGEAIRAAAASSGSAEAAAARVAAQFGGVELPQVIALINAHRELAAARSGGAGAKGYGGSIPADALRSEKNAKAAQEQLLTEQAITRATGSTAEKLALTNNLLRVANGERRRDLLVEQATLRQQLARENARGAGGGAGGGRAGGGGGRASSAAVTANRQRLDLAADTQQKLQEAERDHADRLAEIQRASGERQLEIQRQYAEKQLAAERSLRVGALNSRADFYDALTQASPEIGQQAAEGLAAAYEQAFAQAQQFAQNGQAALASSYLQLRQRQIQEELEYQQALAKAREAKDSAEVARLQQIEALRAQAREEELKQLLENGDANQQARDEGLTEEQRSTAEKLAAEEARYAEQTGKITDASAQKAAKLAGDEQRVRGEIAQTNTALAEQLRLTQAVGTARATGAGLPAAQAAATAPPAGATATGAGQQQAGAASLVEYPALLVSVEALRADVARLDARLGEVVLGVGSTTEAARDTASAVRSQGRGLK
jgi:hypothetical protein